MAWRVEYSIRVRKQLAKIDKSTARRILSYMDNLTLSSDPKIKAKPLTGNLSGLWRFRVGDYRVICDIQDETCIVLALRIGHRSKIYTRDIEDLF